MQKQFFFVLICFFSLLTLTANAQKTDAYQIGAIGFYNVENLFDIVDDEDVRDSEFTPEGAKNYTNEIYQDKLGKLARVISELATDKTPDGVAILGVSEVENRGVLEDLVQQEKIKDRHYRIVHFDSPDERGIDCGLLYNPKYFTVLDSAALKVALTRSNGDPDYTRDILYVAGLFRGEPIHLFVNHWPSRSGGEAASSPKRIAAAKVCRAKCDEIMAQDPDAKIFVMGDLNDDPISPSVANIFMPSEKLNKTRRGKYFNPMTALYKQGIGTLAYRDSWNIFDQIILSSGAARPKDDSWRFWKVKIFDKPYMKQGSGAFRGYPLRTWVGNTYMGGYSDHLPVYVLMIKPMDQ